MAEVEKRLETSVSALVENRCAVWRPVMANVVKFWEYLVVLLGVFSQLLLINQYFQQSSTLENLERKQSIGKRRFAKLIVLQF